MSKTESRIKMKFLKRKGDETTIRKVWNDDKTILYGVVGTVEDMLKVGLLEYCGYPKTVWCFLANPETSLSDRFAPTREEAVKEAEESK